MLRVHGLVAVDLLFAWHDLGLRLSCLIYLLKLIKLVIQELQLIEVLY